MIVIHDNMLVLAIDYHDAADKLRLVITRCIQRNLYLKLSKSSFGITSVQFFGYLCSGKSFRLTDDRINQVTNIPFPTDVKSMQRFLGAAIYFKPFIYNFSNKTVLLTEMTHKSFNWDRSTWLVDYEHSFNKFKEDIINSFHLYYPDNSLDWFLYTDASDKAVGGVLIQRTHDNQQQIIAFVSKKLSKAAINWSTFEKEAYGMFYAVQQLQNFLMGKYFVLFTDHRNLVWIEASIIPKIIRIRLFLQSFDFKILHIAGNENIFADWLSRMDVTPGNNVTSTVVSDNLQLLYNIASNENNGDSDNVEMMLKSVHNARMGHHGLKRTWLLLNDTYPGHKIPQRTISEFISSCPQCQKYRLHMNDSLPAPTRVISGEHRHLCEYDLLYITQ